MKLIKGLGVFLLVWALAVSTTAQASEDDLRAEINTLKSRLSDLESKLAAQPAAPQAGGHTGTEAGPSLSLPSMVQGMALSGYVDTTYNYNFNSPDVLTNNARVFDAEADTFNLNVFKLTFQKPVSAEDRVGYRADLFFGDDAEVIGSFGLGTLDDEFDLEQGFVEVLVPTSNVIPGLNDIDLKIGKFVTMAGAEVIESKDNWNTSRGLLFGYAIPFTHTGVRGTYTFNNGWDLCLGVNNGWDVTNDINTAKTIETHFGFNNISLPGDSSVTVGLQGYFGPEQASDDGSWRNLFDMVVIYKTPWKPLTIMYNYDYADEENALSDPNSAAATLVDNANWSGHAVYARYDINDQWAFSGRYEYFNNDDGVRVLVGTPADFWEFTGTLEYRPWKNIITRLEYRHDGADRDVFLDHSTSGFNDKQDTLGAEVMFIF